MYSTGSVSLLYEEQTQINLKNINIPTEKKRIMCKKEVIIKQYKWQINI